MYQQSATTDYGGVEKIVLPANGHFIDTEPTIIYWIGIRDSAQARKIFAAYRRLYHNESLEHVLMHVSVSGNRLYLSAEGASRLEECANAANVHIKVKKMCIIRKNGK